LSTVDTDIENIVLLTPDMTLTLDTAYMILTIGTDTLFDT